MVPSRQSALGQIGWSVPLDNRHTGLDNRNPRAKLSEARGRKDATSILFVDTVMFTKEAEAQSANKISYQRRRDPLEYATKDEREAEDDFLAPA